MKKVQTALNDLSPTGSNGFEGVLRDVFSEITGHTFGLFKSGPQGGLDGMSEKTSNALVVGFEGKKYKSTTKLPLDQLKAKLFDAARSYPSLDIWVLATTRSISVDDIKALESLGCDLGVDVLVLDWRNSAVPPPIAVLLAAAPSTVAHYFPNDTAIAQELNTVQNHSRYEGERQRLHSRLTESSVGLDTTRGAAARYLLNSMADTSAARKAFDSHATLREAGVKLISREKLNEQIDSWWRDRVYTPLVLLGREGIGKTWAALAWWLQASVNIKDFPITLVIPARDVENSDGPALIASCLKKAANIRDLQFWQRRLQRWSSVETQQPILLLIIDGLNQKPSYSDWDDLIVTLSTPEWRNKVAIIMTCRPDHWHNRLGGLPGLPKAATLITVEGFSDVEIGILLKHHNLPKNAFNESILALLRIPRLSHIVIERRLDLQESGDITEERLVLEDWRHRRHGAQRLLGYEAFKSFVAQLGRDARGNFETMKLTRAELLNRLSNGDGRLPPEFEHVLSELVDGDWLQPTGKPNQFKLKSERGPTAMGLMLVADLSELQNYIDIQQAIVSNIDHLQGMDKAVAILRHATTFALLDSNTNLNVRLALLEQWLGSQNFSGADFDTFWKLIGCDPACVLELAERHWFKREGIGRIDETLDKGFGNAFKWPDVAKPLTSRLVLWFSRYWLDPWQGEVIGTLPDDESASARRQRTLENARQAEEDNLPARYGLKIELAAPEGQAWGSYRAIELLSWLPRAPLVQVYTAWAITRSIMNGPRQFDAMVWNLRWISKDEHVGDADEAPMVLIARARELIADSSLLGINAGETMLRALAVPIAQALCDEAFPITTPSLEKIITWPETPKGTRFDHAPLKSVELLRANPADPTCVLPTPMCARLAAAVDAMADIHMREGSDGGLSSARLALAHWEPGLLARLLRRRYAPSLCSEIAPESNRPVVKSAAEVLLILKGEHLAAGKAIAKFEKQLVDHQDVLLSALLESTATNQISLIENFNHDSQLPDWYRHLLSEPTSADFERINKHLEESDDTKVLLFWLRYLELVGKSHFPRNSPSLRKLMLHTDSQVRARVFEVISDIEDGALADAMAASGWRAGNCTDRHEAGHGSLALLSATSALHGGVIDLVHPEILGELAHIYPAHKTYLERFSIHVRTELELLRKTKSRVYPRSLFNALKGWDELLEDYEDDFREWMRPFFDLSDVDLFYLFGFAEKFPFKQATDVYERLEPGSKALLLEKALDAQKRGNLRLGGLHAEIINLRGPMGNRGRNLLLEEANNDQMLFDFAAKLQERGETAWLVNRIREDLSGSTAATIARALTLAGFLGPQEMGEQLWNLELAAPPANGWLNEVWRDAKQSFQKGRWNLHWLQQFFSRDDDENAFAAFDLFVATIDRRLLIESDVWRTLLRQTSRRRQLHWDINTSRINSAIENSSRTRTDTFLLSKPPLSGQAPSMR